MVGKETRYASLSLSLLWVWVFFFFGWVGRSTCAATFNFKISISCQYMVEKFPLERTSSGFLWWKPKRGSLYVLKPTAWFSGLMLSNISFSKHGDQPISHSPNKLLSTINLVWRTIQFWRNFILSLVSSCSMSILELKLVLKNKSSLNI